MKLFKVVRTFYVMAEDESEAEGYDPRDPSACTNEVEDAEQSLTVEDEWWCWIPFKAEDDRTCGQIITELRRAGVP